MLRSSTRKKWPIWFQMLSSSILYCVTFLFIFTPGVHAEELTLRMLIWDGYAPVETQQAFIAEIKKEFGVDLSFEVSYASDPDEFFNKLRNEEVDLISPAHNLPKDSRFNLTKNDLTLPVNLANIPNYRKIKPELFRQAWGVEGGEVYAVPIVQGIYGLAYDSSVFKTPPVSWSILWEPQYAGRYNVNKDYYELNVYISALSLGKSKEDIFTYDKIKGSPLEIKLHTLAQNAGLFWSGFDKPEHYRNMVLATTWRFTFPEESGFGKNWRVAVPQEGTPWTIDTMMLSHTLKNNQKLRTIAERWINFLLESENQLRVFVENIGAFPVTEDAWDLYSNQLLSPHERDRLRRLQQSLIPWEILKTRDRNAFHLLWRESIGELLHGP